MAKKVDLLNYYPLILKEIREFKVLAEVEEPRTECIWQAVQDALSDQFTDSLTEHGAKRWEGIMGIHRKDTDDLEFRRFRILSRLNEQLPYSYRVLEMQLRTLCGADGYKLILKNYEYKLIVKVALAAKKKYSDVESMLNRFKPCNIVVELTLLYNTHELLGKYTHEQLSKFTHQQLREEVIV